jgi:hypothetical protein
MSTNMYSEMTPKPEMPQMGTMEGSSIMDEQEKPYIKGDIHDSPTMGESSLDLNKDIAKQNKDATATQTRGENDYAGECEKSLMKDIHDSPEVKHS